MFKKFMIVQYLGCMEIDLDVSLWSGARNWSNFAAPICKLYCIYFLHVNICCAHNPCMCVCMFGWAGRLVGCTCRMSHKSRFVGKSGCEGNIQIPFAHTS